MTITLDGPTTDRVVDRSPMPADFYVKHWGRMPPPKFSTRRDFSAPTLGTRQGKFARVWLEQPNMPFQQYVADVAGELRFDEEIGLWVPRYRKVVYLAPRQCGKSHQAMVRKCERCFSRSNWRSWYTAQTGQDARDQFLKAYEENIKSKPLGALVRLKRGRGEEILEFPNGSTIRPHPPTEEKLHGKQSDDNDIDEAWAFTLEEGKALVQAGSPTKLTRPHSQSWIMSAGGTAESTWLAAEVADLRLGKFPDVCYIEFGIPDDADPEDLEVIAAYHPAYGHTVTLSALQAMRADFGEDAAGWARAAGNRWTEIIGGAISPEIWSAAAYEPEIPDGVPLAFGVARASDGNHVVITCAAQVDDLAVVEVVEVLPTGHLAADRVKAWAADCAVGVARNGPSSGIARGLDNLGTRHLLQLTGQDEGAAVANLLDALGVGADTAMPPAVRFRQHAALDAAAKVAATRGVGDGGKAWSRSSAAASIAALESATYAVYALQNRPPDPGPVKVHFRS